MSTVLFIDSVHPILKEDLNKAGYRCISNEIDNLGFLSNQNHDVVGLVLRSRWVIDQKVIDAFPLLKWVARSGSGLENIDLEYCKKSGITVFSSPEGNADAVGEHVLAMCLAMTRKILSAHNSVTHQQWLREEHRGIELKGKTFAIIGLGHMGQAVAHRLLSFGCKIIANDIGLEKSPIQGVRLVSMKELFELADFVSIHLPLSPNNINYANAHFFSSFKSPIYFINTARGQHCVTADLLHALNNKSVLGAALDVLEFESTQLKIESENHPDFHSLLEHPKVIITPHIAGWTIESYYKLSKVLSDKILNLYPQP
jgi:D-3-phosphoglycerate dehydrogenase